ncbi:Rmf/CrpP fold protein [Streptomyces sp. NPDC002402]
MGFRADALAAEQAGREAALAGRPPTDCPHPADSALRPAWVRGYVAARPLPDESGHRSSAGRGASLPRAPDAAGRKVNQSVHGQRTSNAK